MRAVKVVSVAIGLVFLGASGAAAGSHDKYSPDGGANVYSFSPNNYLAVADIKGDGRWVYGYWNREDGAHRVNNKSSYGSVVVKGTSSTVTRVKACTQYDFAPDSGSSWG